MKFLYLCADNGIPILGTKGASVHVREFVRALMKLGHDVRIVCAKLGDGNERGNLDIVEIPPDSDPARIETTIRDYNLEVPLSIPEQNAEGKPLRAEVEKLAYNRVLDRSLGEMVREFQPAVIYERYALFAEAGVRTADKFQLAHLLEINAPLIQERQLTRGLILSEVAAKIQANVFGRTDRILAVSAPMRDYVLEQGVSPERVRVLPNGVDLDKFNLVRGNGPRDALTLRGLGLPPGRADRVIAGFVGSLKPWHGVDLLIDAVATARQSEPRLELLIVGEGPQLETLVSIASKLGLERHIHFTGAVSHRLVPEYLALMDIAVAPYKRQDRFYFSPLKILEYMAMGKAVIASRQGQIDTIVESGINGLLYPPEDKDALAALLIRLARAPEERRRFGESAARTVANHYSWNQVAARAVAAAQSAAAARSVRSREPQRISTAR